MKAVFATLSLAALAAAQSISQCNTGNTSCCNSVQDSTSTLVTQLSSLLGLSLGSITGQVGIGCTPITIAGIGSGTCNAQPVCCASAEFQGLLNLGCTPLSL